jgi:hypothetical protein
MYRLARLKDKVIGREKLLFGKEARAKQGGRHPPPLKKKLKYIM